jgi:lysozyme family protein
VANIILDHAVHNDPTKAAYLLQTELAINNPTPESPIAIDGKIGPATISAANQQDPVVLHNMLADDRVYAYGNYMGNSPSERTAFQERVLENYPSLPMNTTQEQQYNSMLHVQNLQEYVGVKADGVPGDKTWVAVNQFQQQQGWQHEDKQLAPEFVQGLHSWAQEKGIVESARDDKQVGQKEVNSHTADGKAVSGFSNHQGQSSDSKPVQGFSNHSTDLSSNHTGHAHEGRSESRQETHDQKAESVSAGGGDHAGVSH